MIYSDDDKINRHNGGGDLSGILCIGLSVGLLSGVPVVVV